MPMSAALLPRFTLPFALVLLLLTADAFGQTSTSVTSVDVQENEDATVLTIVSDAVPTYSVFTLRNPERLFVDISNSRPFGVPSELTIDNGVVSTVAVEGYRDALTDVTRVIVSLDRETWYDVTTSDNQVMIVLDATRRAADIPVGERVRYSEAAVASAQSDAEEWRGRVEALENEVETLRSDAERAARLEAELEALRATEERVRELESELADARQRAEAAIESAAATELAGDAVAAERARSEALEAELSSTRAQLEQLDEARRQLIAASQADDSEERLQALEAELSSTRAQLEQLDEARRQLIAASQADDSEERLQALEAELAARDEALAELRAAGDADAARDELEQSLSRARASLDETRATLAAADDRAARAEQTAEERAASIAELEAQLAQARAADEESARWEQRARELEAELARRDAEERARAQQTAPAEQVDASDERDGASTLMRQSVGDVSVPDADRQTPGLPTVRVAPEPDPAPIRSTPSSPRTPGQLSESDGESDADDNRRRRDDDRCRAVGTGPGTSTRTRWVPCP